MQVTFEFEGQSRTIDVTDGSPSRPLIVLLHDDPQSRLHERVPDRRVVMVCETLGLRDRPLDDLFQFRFALLIRGCAAGQQRTREN